MKKWFKAVALCVLVTGCAYGQDWSQQAAFNAAYTASKPPEVRALCGIESYGERIFAAFGLALQGAVVDANIDVRCLDPYAITFYRVQYGYKWVPSLFQPLIPVAPGLVQPGTPVYDPTKPPAGSIKVSLDLKDYPPYVVLPPVKKTS